MTRVQLNGRAIRGFGFVWFSKRPQQHAEIAMGIRVSRLDGDRTPVRVDRPFQLAVRLKDDPQVAVPIRLIRHQRKAPLEELDRFVAPPLLVREDSGVVQGVRMIGVRLENAAIQFLSLCELLIFLQQDGERDRLLDCQLARRRFCLFHGTPRADPATHQPRRIPGLLVSFEIEFEMNPCIE
jgi:hypothetical protein